MSFFYTQEQVRARTKTVTRRVGWSTLRVGERFRAVVKAQGLKKGECVEVLAELECVSNMRLDLDVITAADCTREGFPAMSPKEFVAMFCKHMRATPETPVQRIEFKYV